MTILRSLSLLLLAECAIAAPSWEPVGTSVTRVGLTAVSLAFDDGASSADDGVPPYAAGTPLLAVGFDAADTTTDFLRLSADGGSWLEWATHTPQFAQSYAAFRFRFAGGRAFLGLSITNDGALASVLRSGDSGSDGHFEGCYAFEGSAFDYAINSDGDMRLVTVGGDDAASAQTVLLTYNRSGWDGYPASDTFGPAVPLPEPAGGVGDVTVAADAGGRDVLIAALSSAPPAAPSVLVIATTLSNTTSFAAVASPLAGSNASVAVGGGAVCVALVDKSGELRVSCVAEGAAPGGAWVDAGDTGDAGAGIIPPSLALTPSRLLVAAVAANSSSVSAALCQLPAGDGLGACVGGWSQTPLPLAPATVVRGLELKAAASGEVFALVRTDTVALVFVLTGVA